MSSDMKHELRLVIDVTDDDLTAIETTAEQVGREYGFENDDVYEACYFFACAGFDAPGINERIWETADFADHVGLNIPQAAEYVAKLSNLFSIEPDEIEESIELITETVVNYPLTLETVISTLKHVGPHAIHDCPEDTLACLVGMIKARADRGLSDRQLRETLTYESKI